MGVGQCEIAWQVLVMVCVGKIVQPQQFDVPVMARWFPQHGERWLERGISFDGLSEENY
jgi:hypothetical protein